MTHRPFDKSPLLCPRNICIGGGTLVGAGAISALVVLLITSPNPATINPAANSSTGTSTVTDSPSILIQHDPGRVIRATDVQMQQMPGINSTVTSMATVRSTTKATATATATSTVTPTPTPGPTVTATVTPAPSISVIQVPGPTVTITQPPVTIYTSSPTPSNPA